MMLRALFVFLLVGVFAGLPLHAQDMAIDGKIGLSFLTGNGSSTGLLLGGALDVPVDPNLFFRPELNITTHSGTPIEIAAIAKYHLPNTGTKTTLYVDGGLGLWFYSGGSSLGIDFGGGAIFPLEGSNLRIPVGVRLGPIFESGETVFQIALTSGVRFSVR